MSCYSNNKLKLDRFKMDRAECSPGKARGSVLSTRALAMAWEP